MPFLFVKKGSRSFLSSSSASALMEREVLIDDVESDETELLLLRSYVCVFSSRGLERLLEIFFCLGVLFYIFSRLVITSALTYFKTVSMKLPSLTYSSNLTVRVAAQSNLRPIKCSYFLSCFRSSLNYDLRSVTIALDSFLLIHV